jgi:hypothetical protein
LLHAERPPTHRRTGTSLRLSRVKSREDGLKKRENDPVGGKGSYEIPWFYEATARFSRHFRRGNLAANLLGRPY